MARALIRLNLSSCPIASPYADAALMYHGADAAELREIPPNKKGFTD